MPGTLPIIALGLLAVSLPAASSAQATDPTAFGRCDTGTATAVLDIGRVQATVTNSGYLFTDKPGAGLMAPKASGHQAASFAGIGIVGEVDGELRGVLASRYGSDFAPGPLHGSAPWTVDCGAYDRIWELRREDDIESGRPGRDVLEWPVEAGAPYLEGSGEAGYHPESGDQPMFFGDQMLWSIANDVARLPEYSGSPRPLGIEPQTFAFAFEDPGALGNTLFYRYVVKNRSDRPIRNARIGLVMGPGLGYSDDDYVGFDTTLSMAFMYNGDDMDDSGYGEAPPAVGYFLLDGPGPALSGDECLRGPGSAVFSAFMRRDNGASVDGLVTSVRGLDLALSARFADGDSLRFGGPRGRVGDGATEDRAFFQFPGDPVAGAYWSELNVDNLGTPNRPGIREAWAAIGPTCLAPGDAVALTVAVLWSRGSDHLDSVRQLREDAAFIRSISDRILTPQNQSIATPPETVGLSVSLYPIPSNGPLYLRLGVPGGQPVHLEVYDALGRRQRSFRTDTVTAGEFEVPISTRGLPPGAYFLRVEVGRAVAFRPFLVGR